MRPFAALTVIAAASAAATAEDPTPVLIGLDLESGHATSICTHRAAVREALEPEDVHFGCFDAAGPLERADR